MRIAMHVSAHREVKDLVLENGNKAETASSQLVSFAFLAFFFFLFPSFFLLFFQLFQANKPVGCGFSGSVPPCRQCCSSAAFQSSALRLCCSWAVSPRGTTSHSFFLCSARLSL